MRVDLLGSLAKLNQLQFLATNSSGEFIQQRVAQIGNVSNYAYSWTQSEPGAYILEDG